MLEAITVADFELFSAKAVITLFNSHDKRK